MAWWRKSDPRSEFEGRGVLRNTVFPKGPDALNAHDKLRLQSITGQEDDALAEPDPYHWYGNVPPEPDPKPTDRMKIINEADPYPKGY
jgi:hypothetical protein